MKTSFFESEMMKGSRKEKMRHQHHVKKEPRPKRITKEVFYQENEDNFEVLKIDDEIGLGVFSKKTFKASEFLMEYKGEWIDTDEAVRRQIEYQHNNVGNYIFFDVHDISGKKNALMQLLLSHWPDWLMTRLKIWQIAKCRDMYSMVLLKLVYSPHVILKLVVNYGMITEMRETNYGESNHGTITHFQKKMF